MGLKRNTHTHTPGGLWWSDDGCKHLFGLSHLSHGPLVLASVFRGGGLRQAQGEGGALAGRQGGEFAGVDGRRRRLGEGHLGAALLALVFHHGAFQRGSRGPDVGCGWTEAPEVGKSWSV